MSVKIRLARYGTKKKPYYRIVVASTDAPRDGKFLELVGTYDPLKKPAAVTLKQDRVKMALFLVTLSGGRDDEGVDQVHSSSASRFSRAG